MEITRRQNEDGYVWKGVQERPFYLSCNTVRAENSIIKMKAQIREQKWILTDHSWFSIPKTATDGTSDQRMSRLETARVHKMNSSNEQNATLLRKKSKKKGVEQNFQKTRHDHIINLHYTSGKNEIDEWKNVKSTHLQDGRNTLHTQRQK